MNEYLVQEVAREQLNDRIAAARRSTRARRSTVGRGRRARRGAAGYAASGDGAPAVSQAAWPVARAGLSIANNVRHPLGAFRSWLAAGQL